MSGYGDKPWVLVDVKVTDITGTTQVDLPYAMQLSVEERVVSAEMRGDGKTVAVGSMPDALVWSLQSAASRSRRTRS